MGKFWRLFYNCLFLSLIYTFPAAAYVISRCESLAAGSASSAAAYETSKKKLNLVFVEINKTRQERLPVNEPLLIENLKNTVPFNEYQEAISVYKITLSDEEQLAFFKDKEQYPYLSIRQDFLNSLSAYLKRPFKLVIIDHTGNNTCAEISAINHTSVIILSTKRYPQEKMFMRSFLHELGHALGLKDEGERTSVCAPGPPNCAGTKEEAVSWWGDLVVPGTNVNYFGGCCGKRDFIRPTANSLMNNFQKARSYGLVNERYLRSILSKFLKIN